MNPTLHRWLIYHPALIWRGEQATWRLIAEKAALDRYPPEQVEALQRRRLAHILDYAWTHAPLYRARWGQPVRVAPEDALERLSTLPLLEKRDLQEHAAELRVEQLPGKVWTKSTGGSTAEPVTIWKDAAGWAEERAATWAALAWFGIRPSDRVARFWGTALTGQRRRKARLADLGMNRIRVSAFELADRDLAAMYDRFRRFRPTWLYGYATVMDHFAQYVQREGLDGRSLGVRLAVPTSEPLPDGASERLRRAFACDVQNEYGCGEVGAIAYACEAGRLHICAGNVVLEVLRPDGSPAAAGEEGEVVVTDLTNHAMPLVRLRMGDVAVVGGSCDCGRATPTLERVWGRMHDTVYTPTGRRWHGEQMDYLLSTLRASGAPIRQYQVVQVAADLLDVRLVMTGELTPRLVSEITSFVAGKLDGMRANVHAVEQVERSPSGKLRVVRNDFAGAARPPHHEPSPALGG